MIIINATMKAVEGKEKELESILLQLVEGTATEPGAIEYRLHRIKGETGKYRFCEKFKDQEAVDFHLNTPHFTSLGAQLEPLVAETTLEQLELIDSIPEK